MAKKRDIMEALEVALEDISQVVVGSWVDVGEYSRKLREEIRAHLCGPFPVTAKVMPPGFPGVPLGTSITGQCVAHRGGYWLVYHPEQDQFYCFWGENPTSLGAHGVFGTPLYCWST